MTGANTDAVSTSPHVQASSILLKFIRRLFSHWSTRKEVSPLDAQYNAWFALRAIEAAITERRSTRLTEAERERMCDALEVAHHLEHGIQAMDAPPIDTCNCATASDVLELCRVMVEGERRAA